MFIENDEGEDRVCTRLRLCVILELRQYFSSKLILVPSPSLLSIRMPYSSP